MIAMSVFTKRATAAKYFMSFVYKLIGELENDS